jgi:hypothetical protein
MEVANDVRYPIVSHQQKVRPITVLPMVVANDVLNPIVKHQLEVRPITVRPMVVANDVQTVSNGSIADQGVSSMMVIAPPVSNTCSQQIRDQLF